MDISAVSTEDLMRMAGGPDISKVSTEDLMKMSANPAGMQSKLIGMGADLISTIRAPGEIVATFGSGLVGGVTGGITGLLHGITGGRLGTAQGGREAAGVAGDVAHSLTYQTPNPMAQAALRTISGLLDKSKLAGLGPTEGMALAGMPLGQAVGQVTGQIRRAPGTIASMIQRAGPDVVDVRPPASTGMAGGGAAVTEAEALRRARAESLPVPVRLTKGEAGKDFDQVRFEKETAKQGTAAGDVLRQHSSKSNADLAKNMEWFLDESGATAQTARMTGGSVDSALRSRSDLMKAKYHDAYKQAEAAGEMSRPVSTAPLVDWVNENSSAAKLAPVIKAAEDELVRLGGATRTPDGGLIANRMSINDIEKTRKLIVRLSNVDETNAHYGANANKVIDAMTEGQGGELYAKARVLFKEHAGEFKNQGAIKKLLDTKPNSTDRRVALEDVFHHSILGGSMDDTAAIFRSLAESGPKGKEAAANLRGDTIRYLQTAAEKNAGKDINGNPILSYAKLNPLVTELERDGKLEFLFGKKGAQQIRDITDIINDINVAPAGTVNTSTTAAVLKEALGAVATGRLPTAAAKAFEGVKSGIKDYRDLGRARQAIAPPPEPVVVPTRH